MSSPRPPKKEAPTFEQSMTRLESIVRRMDDADTGLEEMIALVEEGLKLIHSSREMLNKAELRITKLEHEQTQPQNTAKPEQQPSDNGFSLF